MQKITAEINFMYLRQPVVPQHGVLELPAPAGYTIGGRYDASSNILRGYWLVHARPVLRHEQKGRAKVKATEWAATAAQMLDTERVNRYGKPQEP